MSAHDTRSLLRDAISAAGDIERYMKDVGLEAYLRNSEKQDAVAMKFVVIGECLNRLSTISDIGNRIDYVRDAVDFRNVIVHGYSKVENDRVFEIARDALPVLKEELEIVLGEIRIDENADHSLTDKFQR